ncbi:MAG: hypothetical protein IJM39_03560 [Firmicutes bacterium]|nr:hypothetical protein [Bacillota bacterium]
MNKSLYSLMLMDEVVDEIDKLALRLNTNRSNLVNQILAEYVSVSTPEKQIDSIFRQMEELIGQSPELVPLVTPNQLSMSVKSSLQYKYRPTVRYVVQLYRTPEKAIGELTVNFRSQSPSLLNNMASFFVLWKRLEDNYASYYFEPGALRYELSSSKFVRTIAVPKGRRYTEEDLSKAISGYVTAFDRIMKRYLAGMLTEHDLELQYLAYFRNNNYLI